jgi:hypothetical protein
MREKTYGDGVAVSGADEGGRLVGLLGLYAAVAVVVYPGEGGAGVLGAGKVVEGEPAVGGEEGGVAEVAEGGERPGALLEGRGRAPGVSEEAEDALRRARAGDEGRGDHGT